MPALLPPRPHVCACCGSDGTLTPHPGSGYNGGPDDLLCAPCLAAEVASQTTAREALETPPYLRAVLAVAVLVDALDMLEEGLVEAAALPAAGVVARLGTRAGVLAADLADLIASVTPVPRRA